MSTNWSACRRNSSATIGGCVCSVETTADALAHLLQGGDEAAEIAVAGEQHDVVEVSASRMASTVSSMSMLPLTLRRPEASVNSFVGFVTIVKPL